MPLLVNRCRTVAENISRIHTAYDEISQLVQAVPYFDNKKTLLHQLCQMKDYGLELAVIAPSYDYSIEVQGNGFRTLIEVGLQFMRHGSRELRSGNRSFLPEYMSVSDNISKVIPHVRKVQLACKDAGSLECSDPALTAQLFHDYVRSEENYKRLFNRTAAFDFGSMGSRIISLIFWQRAISRAPNLTSLVKCIFDRDFRDSQLLLYVRKSTPSSINRIATSSLASLIVHNLYPWLMNGSFPRIRKNFQVKRQSQFLIQLDDDFCPYLIQTSNSSQKSVSNLSCRLIRSEDECKTLMINVHGGAFAIGDMYTNDVFLRYWARKIPSMAVVSLEYTLLPHARFPTQLQEVLDGILFFCNDSNRHAIIRKIGFYPEQIVLSGDSAGACLIMSAVNVMSEIKKKFGSEFRMPSAAFLFYPWLTVHPDVRPSLFISSMTTLLHSIGFYQVMRSYIPIKDHQNKDSDGSNKDLNNNKAKTIDSQTNRFLSWPIISHIFRFLMYIFSTETKMPPAPWKPYRAGQAELVQQIRSSAALSKHPFVSPLFYDDFESLKGMKLYMSACSHDSLLDEAVLMASKWKGMIAFDVMNNLQHGFLHLMLTENSRKAVDLIVKRITDWI